MVCISLSEWILGSSSAAQDSDVCDMTTPPAAKRANTKKTRLHTSRERTAGIRRIKRYVVPTTVETPKPKPPISDRAA